MYFLNRTHFAAIIANIEAQKAVLRESLAESEGLLGGVAAGVWVRGFAIHDLVCRPEKTLQVKR